MLLFFITMALKRIHAFKAMADYAQVQYRRFGFASPPSRKTLRRRFLALPAFLHSFMPEVASEAGVLDERFRFRTTFVDKSLFRALGGLWHKKQIDPSAPIAGNQAVSLRPRLMPTPQP